MIHSSHSSVWVWDKSKKKQILNAVQRLRTAVRHSHVLSCDSGSVAQLKTLPFNGTDNVSHFICIPASCMHKYIQGQTFPQKGQCLPLRLKLPTSNAERLPSD